MAKLKKSLRRPQNLPITPKNYATFIAALKNKIRSTQLKASLSVNRELIRLYWEIGRDVVGKVEQEGWGSGVIEKVARDLQNEFPGIEGFSRSNIFRMKAFYEAYPKVAQAVRQLEDLPVFTIPWGHNIAIIQQVKDEESRLWYAHMVIAEGWSRKELLGAMKRGFRKRFGKAITNFQERLPSPHSKLARETVKDPYHFDFLELPDDHLERDLEKGLLDHLEKFMRELGHGFAFVGRQTPLQINDKVFYIDLLFYHLKLRCFVVVELKATEFKAEFAGKMNLYLSAVDDLMKHSTDNPTIGILICQKKDNFIVEYALRDIHKPMGVSEYETKMIDSLPKKLQGQLPTIGEIEAELDSIPVLKPKKSKKKR